MNTWRDSDHPRSTVGRFVASTRSEPGQLALDDGPQVVKEWYTDGGATTHKEFDDGSSQVSRSLPGMVVTTTTRPDGGRTRETRRTSYVTDSDDEVADSMLSHRHETWTPEGTYTLLESSDSLEGNSTRQIERSRTHWVETNTWDDGRTSHNIDIIRDGDNLRATTTSTWQGHAPRHQDATAHVWDGKLTGEVTCSGVAEGFSVEVPGGDPMQAMDEVLRSAR